jgi:hypothetical protein
MGLVHLEIFQQPQYSGRARAHLQSIRVGQGCLELFYSPPRRLQIV